MATERVDIIVSEKGSRVVRRNFEDLGQSAKGADTAVRLLNRALGLIAGVASVRQLQQLVDTYTNLQNRLRQVTTGTANLAAVTNNLFDIANRTRSSYEGTAELYARVALATKELGVSQQELLTFTERVNQAIILSGASAQEASAGLIQLSQGLASGTLRGDELRSVLEQLPAVADVIAKHLKVTRGELRQLGADAKITTEIILAAFRNAGNVSEAFADTVPTVGQAFTVLNNQITRAVGEFDKATGLSAGLARSMITLAMNIDQVAKAVTSLAVAMAFLAGPAVIGKLLGVVSALWNLFKRHPLMIITSVVAGLVSAFIQFDDTLDDLLKTAGRSVTVFDRLVAGFAGIRAYIEKAWEDFPEWLASIFIRAVNGAIKTLEKFINFIGDTLGSIFEVDNARLDLSQYLIAEPERFAKAGDAAAMAYKQAFAQTLMDRSTDVSGGALNPAGQNMTNPSQVDEKAVKKFQQQLRQLMDQIDPVEAAWREWGEAQATLNKAFEIGALDLNDYDKIMGQAYRHFEDALFPVQALTREMDRQIELLKLEANERERLSQIYTIEDQLKRKLTETERGEIENRLKRLQLLQVEADIMDSIQQPQENYFRTTEALLNLLSEGTITYDQYIKKLDEAKTALLELERTAEGGFNRGLLQIKKDFSDVSDLIQQSMVDAFKGMEDALVEFVTTGKLSFNDLANSILADINRILIRQSITGPLANMLGGEATSGNTGDGWFSTALGNIGNGISNWFQGLFGANYGADFTVGGAGGVDSQLVALRATPGERVTVTKPGDDGPAPSRQSLVMNVYAQDANSFRKSRGQIMNDLGVGLARANRRNR